MAIEYFHIRENDREMLTQLLELEEALHPNEEESLNVFELSAFIKYGRVYAAVEDDEILGCVFFMRDFENPGKVFLYAIDVIRTEAHKNLGVSLLMSAFGDLKESEVRMVEVLVDPANFSAIKKYREQLNFKIINITDEDDEDVDEDELLILRRTL